MRTAIVFCIAVLCAGAAGAADQAPTPSQAPAAKPAPVSKQACLASIRDVKKSYDDRDIGGKASAEVQKVIEVAEHLCERENYPDAKSLIDLARSMLATE